MPEEFVHAEFNRGALHRQDLAASPIDQFATWYRDAQAANISEYPAMTLATCSPEGRPSARILYLRGHDDRGFCFYTNYDSRKGHEIAANSHAALCFYWKELERQVRIEGLVNQVASAESDAYFAGRPLESQLGAWASAQSEPLESELALQERLETFRQKFAGQPVTRPANWGGYRLQPIRIEFWQGRPSRLHDRFVYTLERDGTWAICRLNP